jgi:UDP-N-acetylglucosamine--N-acetylmuramyl-(pentapeptide) pyrophosphoryl-undecaprenol N-acetylglucosamine transferase
VSPKIVLTGGGTAGHVTPNIALIDVLQREGWQIDYIGSANSVEQSMITAVNIPFHSVRSGKLRRYFSWKNFFDPLNILLGIGQSYRLLRTLKPDVVFSKGGFVGFPVVVGAWLNRIPVVAHESDMSPGLANRLSFPFVNKICVTFAAAKKHFKRQEQVEVTGTPIRQELFEGNKQNGLALCGFNNEKPCLLVVGGSQGAQVLNVCVRQALDRLSQDFQVIHLCGKAKVDPSLVGTSGYCQFEYANQELADLFAASELVISRSGANSLYEILALNKPHVLVPLSMQASRGDQIQNARYFQQQGISVVVKEEALTPETMLSAVNEVNANRSEIIKKIKQLAIESATTKIIDVIKEQAHVKYLETA